MIDSDPMTQNILGENGLMAINGLSSSNGLMASNGLMTSNGLSSSNGLMTSNGLSSSNGLMTSNGGRLTASYLVKCALSAGDYIDKQDNLGATHRYHGALGLGTSWKSGTCDTACQEWISACMMAHVNTTGVKVPIWLVADPAQQPQIGLGEAFQVGAPQTQREGSFFGNIVTANPPVANFVFDSGMSATVAGRIGSGQSGAPYVNYRAFKNAGDMTECADWKANPTNTSHTDPVACGPTGAKFTRVLTSYVTPPPDFANPGFETGNTSGWTNVGAGTADWARSAGMHGATLPSTTASLSQTITGLSPGTTYTAWLWTFIDDYGNSGTGSFTMQVSGFGGTTLNATTTTRNSWIKVAQVFTTGASSTSATIKMFAGTMPSGYVRFDEAKLDRGSDTLLVTNPGFESGFTGWTTNMSGYGGNDYARRSGNLGVSMLGTSEFGSQTISGLLPNTVYRASVWMYVQSNGVGTGSIEVSGFGGTTASSTVSTRNTWTKVSRSFITGASSTSVTIKLNVPVKPDHQVLFDDVELSRG